MRLNIDGVVITYMHEFDPFLVAVLPEGSGYDAKVYIAPWFCRSLRHERFRGADLGRRSKKARDRSRGRSHSATFRRRASAMANR